MELASSGALLALSTMFLLTGAGAFAVLAVLAGALPSGDVRWRSVDTLAAIPSLAVVLGFATACFALQDHTSAVDLLCGLHGAVRFAVGGLGAVFAFAALTYGIAAFAGKLSGGTRRPFLHVVGALAALFVAVLGVAHQLVGDPLWEAPSTTAQVIGLALLGGSTLGVMMLESAGALAGAATKRKAAVCTLAGAVLSIGGLITQIVLAAGAGGGLGADLACTLSTHIAVGLFCLVAAVVFTLMALRMKEAGYHSVIAVACAFIGTFCVRLVFYALQGAIA